MTTQPAAPITTPRALAALQDAIREEVRRELIEQLRTWRDSSGFDDDDYASGYFDGINDSINTLERGA